MRKIKELLESNKKVWFYLGEEQEPKDLFCAELNELGCTFLNGDDITGDRISRIMSVHDDGKAAHVALFVWTAAFGQYRESFENVPKIDYMKYVRGEDDYEMKTPKYRKVE